MTIIFANPNVTNEISLTCFDPTSAYVAIDENIIARYVSERSPDTASASPSTELEEEISPYELACGSGVLAFWDEPEEDIYSSEDGEAL